MRRFALLLLPLVFMAGCGGSPNDPGEGGVTKAEADALDRAAETVDRQQASANLNAPAARSER